MAVTIKIARAYSTVCYSITPVYVPATMLLGTEARSEISVFVEARERRAQTES